MAFLRYLMLLSLVVWIGGLIFFAFVLIFEVDAFIPTFALRRWPERLTVLRPALYRLPTGLDGAGRACLQA